MNNKLNLLEKKAQKPTEQDQLQNQKHMIIMNSPFKPKQFRYPEHIVQNPLKSSLSNINSYNTPSFNREKVVLQSVNNQILPCISDENSRNEKDDSISRISNKINSSIDKTVQNLIQIVENKQNQPKNLRELNEEKMTSSELLIINNSQTPKIDMDSIKKDNSNDEQIKITLSIDKVNCEDKNGYLYTIYNNDLIEGNIFVKDLLVKNMKHGIKEERKLSFSREKKKEFNSKRKFSIMTNDTYHYTPKDNYKQSYDSGTIKSSNRRYLNFENSSKFCRNNSNTTTHMNSSIGKKNGNLKKIGKWPLQQQIMINEINLVYISSNICPISKKFEEEKELKNGISEKNLSINKENNISNKEEEQLNKANNNNNELPNEKPIFSKKININNSSNVSCVCTIF